ncbi:MULTISPECIES: OmpH family outer membrane protein [Thermodesulfovibrio]|uniref:Outer membrane protein, putative n=1 Tax=Thermodesulfovibrio yellowstonii (strain ATCC 51303 / DSM 11347 / YP87) TaxID=289376 RepID=B5YHC3_THEYD|nr:MULTISPECIES: OmpH family outer membrane protein [Thermodesulfovibrio]ACI20321.1 outer membrane protein, putative [Thermodesulfovibrio yellowstonii DSM 11347]MDI6865466.1 OmpH family outer membrane protein [Thermodesulfovibrio yellowstonii]
MKRILFVVFIMVFALSFVSLAHADLKIGVVDLYRVLNESEEGKKSVNELQSMLESRQKTLEEKQKKIQSLKEELEKKRSVLSEDARKAKEEEIERLGRDFQRTAADYQVELQKKQNEITQSMLKEIRQLINDFAQKEGYNLIFEKAEQIILFATPEVDITDKIISLFNQKTSQQKGKK